MEDRFTHISFYPDHIQMVDSTSGTTLRFEDITTVTVDIGKKNVTDRLEDMEFCGLLTAEFKKMYVEADPEKDITIDEEEHLQILTEGDEDA